MKKTKRKNNLYKILLILAVIIVIIYVLVEIINLIKKPTNIVTIESGKIYSECQAEGYIIRDETILKGENYKNGIFQIKSEGEKIAVDESAFRYYTKDEDNITSKIQELDSQISSVQQQSENTVFSSDVKVLESEIEEKLKELYRTNDVKKIKEYKNSIDSYMKKKTRIIGELSPLDSKLKELIRKRSEFENKLNSGSEYMKANISGMLSYKIDGYEEILTPASIDSLNEKMLNDINIKNGQIIATNSECGKIINNYYCYIITVLSKEKAEKLEQGKYYKLRLINGDEVSSKVEKIRDDNNKKIIVFKITKDVEDLIEYRKINFDIIYWSYSGLKVPNSAIIKKDNLNYVIRNRAGYRDEILVKIKKSNENYSIIEDYTTEELKELGWTTQEIINKRSIGIYDEVLVNANENK